MTDIAELIRQNTDTKRTHIDEYRDNNSTPIPVNTRAYDMPIGATQENRKVVDMPGLTEHTGEEVLEVTEKVTDHSQSLKSVERWLTETISLTDLARIALARLTP